MACAAVAGPAGRAVAELVSAAKRSHPVLSHRSRSVPVRPIPGPRARATRASQSRARCLREWGRSRPSRLRGIIGGRSVRGVRYPRRAGRTRLCGLRSNTTVLRRPQPLRSVVPMPRACRPPEFAVLSAAEHVAGPGPVTAYAVVSNERATTASASSASRPSLDAVRTGVSAARALVGPLQPILRGERRRSHGLSGIGALDDPNHSRRAEVRSRKLVPGSGNPPELPAQGTGAVTVSATPRADESSPSSALESAATGERANSSRRFATMHRPTHPTGQQRPGG